MPSSSISFRMSEDGGARGSTRARGGAGAAQAARRLSLMQHSNDHKAKMDTKSTLRGVWPRGGAAWRAAWPSGGGVSGMLRCACFGKGAAAESGAYDEGAAKVLCEADRGDACVFVTALKLRDGAGGPEGGGMRVGIALRHAASRGEQVRRAQPGRKMRHRICSSVCARRRSQRAPSAQGQSVGRSLVMKARQSCPFGPAASLHMEAAARSCTAKCDACTFLCTARASVRPHSLGAPQQPAARCCA